jgi:cell pole-organizing protein PopZ
MEEILASIRRIIADDDGAKAQPPKAVENVAPQPTPVPPPRTTATPPFERSVPPSSVLPTANEPDDFPVPASFTHDHEPEPQTAEMSPDIFDLTEQMAEESAPAEGLGTADADLDMIFEEAPPPPMPPKMAAEPPTPEPPAVAEPPAWHAPPRAEQSLMSTATSAAVDSAFNTLAQTVLVQNGRTLEDLVREMLRPMLKTWLDDNLPGMVERLVRAEIERVSRGRT